MKPSLVSTGLAAFLLHAGLSIDARAITAADLSAKLAAGRVIHLIDLRPSARFETGTIPGAMSVPATIIREKKLPPLSPVVLFDDGLGKIDVAAIVSELNQRPGWRAEVLDGGFAAWQALANAPRTSANGLRGEDIQHITYQSLTSMKDPVVVVDVREVDPATTARTTTKAVLGKKPAQSATPDPVSAYCAKAGNRIYRRSLDDLRRTHEPPAKTRSMPEPRPGKAAPDNTPPLVVLVGAVGDNLRETARRLRSEGYTRVLILAGGDESILLEGKSGKGRMSGPIIEGKVPNTEPSTPATP